MISHPGKESILEANNDFYRAFSVRDLNEMSRFWWQGETGLCIYPGGQLIVGWESIRASWKGIFKNTDSLEIETEVVKVDQVIAYILVHEVVLQSSRGRKLTAQSIATNIFQKMAQKCYLVHHHGSPIMP